MSRPVRRSVAARLGGLLGVLAAMPALVPALATAPAAAADLFGSDPATLLRTETFSAEAFVGYVRNSAREYVFNLPGGTKLSQLNWETQGAAVGGRLAVRPLDWLTLRVRGWALVASDNKMVDYDWLAGYSALENWDERSRHPDTTSPKAWKIDASAAVGLYEVEDLGFYAIGGYRQFTQKYRANGGSFVYSIDAFRDAVGRFGDGLVGTYQQWWRTPYAGLGATWTTPEWTASAELVGSPFAMGDARDSHVLRDIIFKDNLSPTGFVGASASLEYRVSPLFSLVGRVEYEKYLQATGSEWLIDHAHNTVAYYPKPGVGAAADSFLLSLGAKVRL